MTMRSSYLIHRQLLALAPDGDGGAAGSGAAATLAGDKPADAIAPPPAAGAAAGSPPAAETPEAKAAADKATADKAAADKIASDKVAADAAAATAAKPAAPKVPEKYDLKLPEKTTLDATALERTTAIARELGLPDTANAQKVLDFVNQEVAAAREAAIADVAKGGEAWVKQDESWRAAALADPVLGNGKQETLDANVGLAKRVLAKFGDDQSRDFLETSGLGSHPGALRLLVAIGKAMSEGSLVLPASGSAAKTEADTAKKLYDNSPDMK